MSKLYAATPTSLSSYCLSRALIGMAALERGGDLTKALGSISGIQADGGGEDGTTLKIGDVPSAEVQSGEIDVAFDTYNATLKLTAGEGISVGGMVDGGLAAKEFAAGGVKPIPGLKT